MISKTKCKDDLYTMNVIYLVIDIYDWDKNEEKMLYNMHACGLARSYYAIGEYETSFSWKKGQRFTNPYINNDIIEPEKLFNSKIDIYLDTVYKQTKLKYPEMFINMGG